MLPMSVYVCRVSLGSYLSNNEAHCECIGLKFCCVDGPVPLSVVEVYRQEFN